MKKFLGFAAAALLFAGCSKDNDDHIAPVQPEEQGGGYTTLGAYLPESRTFLDGDKGAANRKVFWSADDQIAVWSNLTREVRLFELTSGENTASGVFNLNKETSDIGIDIFSENMYAVYPRSIVKSIEGKTATIELPAAQSCSQEANFDKNVNPMAAHSTTMAEMNFQSLCGIMVVKVTSDTDLTVNSIVLKTGGQPICGTGTITLGETSTLAMSGAADQLTLTCKDRKLKANEEQEFYIVVPAGTYNGLRVSVYTSRDFDNATVVKTRRSDVTFQPGKITLVGASFSIKDPVSYEIGDTYPKGNTTPLGIVFAVENDGQKGKILPIELIDGTYKYLNNATSGGKDEVTEDNIKAFGSSTTDGLANMKKALAYDADLTIFPALKACYDYRAAHGNLEWYIPALDEMKAIIANLSNLLNSWQDAAGSTSTFIPGTQYITSTVVAINDPAFGIYGQLNYYLRDRRGGEFKDAFFDELTDANNTFSVLPIAQFDTTK